MTTAPRQAHDPDVYRSLQWMLDNPIAGVIMETFSVEADEFGRVKVIDLKEDGSLH